MPTFNAHFTLIRMPVVMSLYIQTALSIVPIFLLVTSFFDIEFRPIVLTSLSQRSENGRVFIGVITIPNSTRRYKPWTEWMYRLNMQNFHKAMFIEDPQNDYKDYYLQTNQSLMRLRRKLGTPQEDRDRAAKRVTGAQYMLKHNEFDWYWSLTDDVMVDTAAMDNYIAELSRVYDPKKDFVVRGQYIYRHKMEYLQGGSGYIFSRAAVEKFVEKEKTGFSMSLNVMTAKLGISSVPLIILS